MPSRRRKDRAQPVGLSEVLRGSAIWIDDKNVSAIGTGSDRAERRGRLGLGVAGTLQMSRLLTAGAGDL